VSHCPLLRDNSRYLKRFLPSLGPVPANRITVSAPSE